MRKRHNKSIRVNKKNAEVLKVKKFGSRIECVGGCGSLVLRKQQECRDCRRRRRHAGLRITRRANPLPKTPAKVRVWTRGPRRGNGPIEA